MRRVIVAVGLVQALLFAPHSLACEGKTVIFEDQFQDETGGWELDEDMKAGPSGLTVLFKPENTSYRKLNATFFVKDADLCVEAAFPPKPENNPTVGVRFWAADYENFYIFQVNQSGKASMWRHAGGKWFKVFEQDVPSIKTGPGTTNVVRVVTKGNLISSYVNGTKVRDVRGQPPAGDSRFGFYLQMDKPVQAAEGRTFMVKNYKVTSVD